MKVYFISAGPGSPDLITVRGLEIIKKCKMCLYAGSLVPEKLISQAPSDSEIINTAPMHLQEIIGHIKRAAEKNIDVARVHSGDCSIYGAVKEQMRQLDMLNIEYEVVPGVSAYAAMAAKLKTELTLPEISQTVILTRTSVKSSSMPEGEELSNLAKSKSTMAIHLSINNLAKVVKELTPHYGKDCPVSIGYRVSWDDEKFIHGTLENIREKIKQENITRTALILVGHVLQNTDFMDSKLYDSEHWNLCRDEQKSL